MRVHLPSETLTGDAIDLRGRGLTVERVARAVREADSFVECPRPGALHERAGVVREAAALRVRTALALAARSRGLAAPQDDERARLERRLEALGDEPVERVDASDVRRRVADAASDVARLRERVAALQGRVRALRGTGDEAGVADAPGPTSSDPADPTDPFAADGVTATLAVLRVGEVRAPVVLACDRFDGAAAAAEWLDAPVLRL
ncbi:hypothetical protein ACFQPA_10125 [Halomarina halobia]|uniref:Uncharacterized protein n=1 Tax=Halomarina halobia TaxID=3033386 RepID=A0ABD6AAF0_9EURY|nr:hypothetical protein [Halomarina sp. PSR21]